MSQVDMQLLRIQCNAVGFDELQGTLCQQLLAWETLSLSCTKAALPAELQLGSSNALPGSESLYSVQAKAGQLQVSLDFTVKL